MAAKPTNVTPHELGFRIVHEVSMILNVVIYFMTFVVVSEFEIKIWIHESVMLNLPLQFLPCDSQFLPYDRSACYIEGASFTSVPSSRKS
jgi:hypothetical protein